MAVNMEANPKWHVHMTLCTSNTHPPPVNAIGLANITELFIISEIDCIVY